MAAKRPPEDHERGPRGSATLVESRSFAARTKLHYAFPDDFALVPCWIEIAATMVHLSGFFSRIPCTLHSSTTAN